ncbi:MAG TPA: ABC transporter permease [Bacteroidia bacterium]|nr:ABC transporter permease [Bacteroidia bacterium]
MKPEQDMPTTVAGDSPKSIGFWKAAWTRFQKRGLNRIAFRFVLFLVAVAVFADFISYNKPLVCKRDGTVYFPVVADYLASWGLYRWDKDLINEDWHVIDYEWAFWPPVRYLPADIDYQNQRLTSPFSKQKVESWKSWHYFGTDRDGRDVLSGLIHGTRISLTIGLVSTGIAGIIGMILGSLAGFYGDTRFQLTTAGMILGCIGLVLGYFYGFQVRGYALKHAMEAGASAISLQFLLSLAIMVGTTILCIQLARPFKKVPFLGTRRDLWIDIIISRFIEIFSTIPTLLLIITVMAITEKRSIFFIMVILGVLGWTGVARFTRAEMLRTRSQEFIEAARAMGLSNARVMLRHALPNSLASVVVVLTFGVASAIIVEAALSFLGIGVPDDVVTWGSLLRTSRSSLSAWWLSVFPGVAVFLTITAINLIGEGFRDALDPKLRNEK